MRAVSRGHTAGALLAALGVLFPACASLGPAGARLPLGAVPVMAPAVYREWYQRTQACSGLAGDFAALHWYVVPGVSTFATTSGVQVGMWARELGTNRIVIAGNYAGNEMVIRHEVLHALLGRSGHPPEYFASRCHLTWETWGSIASSEQPSP